MTVSDTALASSSSSGSSDVLLPECGTPTPSSHDLASIDDHPLALVLDTLGELPGNWHRSGCLSAEVLRAIARYTLDYFGRPLHTLETGSGKSTVLFSHLSQHHLVFAWDRGDNSIKNVVEMPIFQPELVEFIHGPTQKTLPAYDFQHSIQVALIDGPHGYPFPDLEYYYIYPLLESGALLIVDDIHIPSIQNLLHIIQSDDMFELLEVVENTAFLRRTDAPTFNPLGDGWWTQGYNRSVYECINCGEKFRHGQLVVQEQLSKNSVAKNSVAENPVDVAEVANPLTPNDLLVLEQSTEMAVVRSAPWPRQRLTTLLKRSIPEAWKRHVPHSVRVGLGRWL